MPQGAVRRSITAHLHLQDLLGREVAQQAEHVAPHGALGALEPLPLGVVQRQLVARAHLAALALKAPRLAVVFVLLVPGRPHPDAALACRDGVLRVLLPFALRGWLG